MGLDMYLYAKEYISGKNYLTTPDKGFHSVPNPRFDMVARAFDLTANDLEPEMPSAYIQFKVIQWRKSNAIHQWFVDNVQGGEDDCREYYVGREDLESLLSTIGEALDLHYGRHNGDPDITIEDLLPTQSGFFFGSTDYDEWYWQDLERTYEDINKLLNNEKFNNFDFAYQSSW